jgi:hypothetical protein
MNFFSINKNNIIGKDFANNSSLILSYYLPFIQNDLNLSYEDIRNGFYRYIKRQKYFLKKSKASVDNYVFSFVTEPGYDYLIDEHYDFVRDVLSSFGPGDIILNCFKNNRITNFDYHLFHYYKKEVKFSSDFFDFLESYNPLKEKTFITLNHRCRQHRIDLKNLYDKHDLYKNSFYSFMWSNKFNFENNASYFSKTLNSVEETDYILRKIKNSTFQKYFSNDDLWTNINIVTLFKKSYFYIVTERDYSNHCIFPSEKIYKSFLYKIPFIHIGNPGMLKYLKERGFKTFNDIIDESYDFENDYERRKRMIYSEILRIQNSPMNLFYNDKLYNILDHNYKLMKSIL